MESTLLDSKLDAALHLTESAGLHQLSCTIDELERTAALLPSLRSGGRLAKVIAALSAHLLDDLAAPDVKLLALRELSCIFADSTLAALVAADDDAASAARRALDDVVCAARLFASGSLEWTHALHTLLVCDATVARSVLAPDGLRRVVDVITDTLESLEPAAGPAAARGGGEWPTREQAYLVHSRVLRALARWQSHRDPPSDPAFAASFVVRAAAFTVRRMSQHSAAAAGAAATAPEAPLADAMAQEARGQKRPGAPEQAPPPADADAALVCLGASLLESVPATPATAAAEIGAEVVDLPPEIFEQLWVAISGALSGARAALPPSHAPGHAARFCRLVRVWGALARLMGHHLTDRDQRERLHAFLRVATDAFDAGAAAFDAEAAAPPTPLHAVRACMFASWRSLIGAWARHLRRDSGGRSSRQLQLLLRPIHAVFSALGGTPSTDCDAFRELVRDVLEGFDAASGPPPSAEAGEGDEFELGAGVGEAAVHLEAARAWGCTLRALGARAFADECSSLWEDDTVGAMVTHSSPAVREELHSSVRWLVGSFPVDKMGAWIARYTTVEP